MKKMSICFWLSMFLASAACIGAEGHTYRSNCRLNTTATAREEGQCPACQREEIERVRNERAEDQRKREAHDAAREAERQERQRASDQAKASARRDKPVELTVAVPKSKPSSPVEHNEARRIRIWAVLTYEPQRMVKGVHSFYTPVYTVDTYPLVDRSDVEARKRWHSHEDAKKELQLLVQQAALSLIESQSLGINGRGVRKLQVYVTPDSLPPNAGLPLNLRNLVDLVGTPDKYLQSMAGWAPGGSVAHRLEGLEFKRAIHVDAEAKVEPSATADR